MPPRHRQRLPPILSTQALASMGGEVAGERIMLCLRNESRREDKDCAGSIGKKRRTDKHGAVRDFFYSRINVPAGIYIVRCNSVITGALGLQLALAKPSWVRKASLDHLCPGQARTISPTRHTKSVAQPTKLSRPIGNTHVALAGACILLKASVANQPEKEDCKATNNRGPPLQNRRFAFFFFFG